MNGVGEDGQDGPEEFGRAAFHSEKVVGVGGSPAWRFYALFALMVLSFLASMVLLPDPIGPRIVMAFGVVLLVAFAVAVVGLAVSFVRSFFEMRKWRREQDGFLPEWPSTGR